MFIKISWDPILVLASGMAECVQPEKFYVILMEIEHNVMELFCLRE